MRGRRCSPRTSGSPPRSGASTGISWSTSTRTSARCSRGCSTCGSATATTSAWSATPARRSTPSPAPRRTTCSTSRPGTRRRPWSGSVRDYRSTPQVVNVANGLLTGRRGQARRHRLTLRSQRPDGPPPVFSEYADEVAEARRGGRARSRACLARDPAPRDRRPLPDQRSVGGLRAGARRARRPLPCCAAPSGSSIGRRSARRPSCSGVRAGAPGPPEPAWSPTCAPSSPRRGGRRSRRPARARSANAGSPWSPSPRSRPTSRPQQPEARPRRPSPRWTRRAAAQHAPPADGVTLATLHAAKGLEWDARVPGRHPRGHAADHLRRDPRRRWRRSAGCSTSG